MWPGATITKIEILPDSTLQIDFIEDWKNHRCFISNSDFFSMYWEAIKIHWEQILQYNERKSVEKFIYSWKEWELFNEDWSIFTLEEAKKELEKLKKKSIINYNTFKMYIEWNY